MTAFSKIAIGLALDLRLPPCNRLKDNLRFAEEIIEATTSYRVTITIS